jgi:hypothetical protein
METKQNERISNVNCRVLFMCLALAILSGLAISCDDDDDKVDNRSYTLSGDAGGSQMVPAVSGSGSGTITGTYNPSTRELNYTSNWNGLTGAPTSGGFYNGASGTSGTAVGNPWTFASGSTGTGSTTGTMTLTSAQADQLLGGNWYYSYGTTANAGGEVRGQISATR